MHESNVRLPVSLTFPACSSSFSFFLLSSATSWSNFTFHARKFSIVTTVPWNATWWKQTTAVIFYNCVQNNRTLMTGHTIKHKHKAVWAQSRWTTHSLASFSFLPSLLPPLRHLFVVFPLRICFLLNPQFRPVFPERLWRGWKSWPCPGSLQPAGWQANAKYTWQYWLASAAFKLYFCLQDKFLKVLALTEYFTRLIDRSRQESVRQTCCCSSDRMASTSLSSRFSWEWSSHSGGSSGYFSTYVNFNVASTAKSKKKERISVAGMIINIFIIVNNTIHYIKFSLRQASVYEHHFYRQRSKIQIKKKKLTTLDCIHTIHITQL